LLNLLALGLDVHLMLEVGSIGSQIGRTAITCA
jgi:hypothetical protein